MALTSVRAHATTTIVFDLHYYIIKIDIREGKARSRYSVSCLGQETICTAKTPTFLSVRWWSEMLHHYTTKQ